MAFVINRDSSAATTNTTWLQWFDDQLSAFLYGYLRDITFTEDGTVYPK
jgi:hypothetical protein